MRLYTKLSIAWIVTIVTGSLVYWLSVDWIGAGSFLVLAITIAAITEILTTTGRDYSSYNGDSN